MFYHSVIKTKAAPRGTASFFGYIIPIPPPAGIAGTSSLMFATTDSVVNKALVKSDDSILVDTTNTTVDEAVSRVLELAKERISND